MKKIMFLAFMFMLIQPVLALTGGDSINIFDGECTELLVSISISPIQDEGEYTLEPDCTALSASVENNVKSFKCICTDNRTTLTLTTAVNSAGNYTYVIEQYALKDDETIEPITYNTTNPTSQNITTTITLPNNVTVDRIIPPGEELVYIETKEAYVIIPEFNVTIQSITSDSENINLQVTSSGEKCFDIYAEKGEPYSIKVNDNPITFTYNETTKIVNFCLTFSTKEIIITWVVPAPTPSGGGTFFRPTCTPNYNCSEWSECNETGYQTRICEDLNNCSAVIQQTQACEYTPEQEPEKEIEEEILTEEPEEVIEEDRIIEDEVEEVIEEDSVNQTGITSDTGPTGFMIMDGNGLIGSLVLLGTLIIVGLFFQIKYKTFSKMAKGTKKIIRKIKGKNKGY